MDKIINSLNNIFIIKKIKCYIEEKNNNVCLKLIKTIIFKF